MRMLGIVMAVALMGCEKPVEEEQPLEQLEPSFKAGFAKARIPAPVGIGTSGYGPFGVDPSKSPFADIYPATTGVIGHPEFKAVALEREGDKAIYMLRIDTVGVFAQLRNDVTDRLSQRLGRDMEDAVIIGATHTHAGPGRVLNSGGRGGVFDVIVDTFHPEFYERFVETAVDTLEAAHNDLATAELGVTMAQCLNGHKDRRCEDGEEYTNSTLPLIGIRREGKLETLLMSYAVHGTALGIGDLYLSQDVHGAIEQAVEDRFDSPVEVVVFNSWGADMSPNSHPDLQDTSSDVPLSRYRQMLRTGETVADVVESSIDSMTWEALPEISLKTFNSPINREVLGYDDDTFPYDYGALYCGSELGDCENPTPIDDLDKFCLLRFTEEAPAPTQFTYSVGQLGSLSLVTFPGEPGTRLAESVMEKMEGVTDQDVWFMGYSQDYLGYAVEEREWWLGGYEASGHIWGPGQGDLMRDNISSAFNHTFHGAAPPPTVDRLEPYPTPDFTPYVPMTATGNNEVTVDVPERVTVGEAVPFTFQGQDPWFGAPKVTLETEEGDVVLRSNGMEIDGDSYYFETQVAYTPSFEDDPDASEREILWTVQLMTEGPADGGWRLPEGLYQIRAEIPSKDSSTQVVSSTFAISSDEGPEDSVE